jgi:hypothetical protein
MNSEIQHYYKLASTVIEYVREETLSAQKLEEMTQKFFVKVGETDATEAQVEDGCALQNKGTIEVGLTLSKYVLVSIDLLSP